MILVSLIYCLLHAGLTEGTTLRVEGPVGGVVSFQCSHKIAWGYNKYFCKDPCGGGGDTLAAVAPGERAESGRISLADSGNGVFRVTFRELRLSDSHKYFCAVERPAAVDTYITVYLTVRDVSPTVGETTTLRLDVSSAGTREAASNSTPLGGDMDPTVLANPSTASNVTFTPAQGSRTDVILSAAVGGAAAVAILILAACIRRKRAGLSKPQAPLCSTSKDASNAHESEVDYEYDDIDIVRHAVQKMSKGTSSSARRPAGDSPAASSGAAASHHIYENQSSLKTHTRTKCPAANKTPLLTTKTKRACAGPVGKPRYKPGGINDNNPCRSNRSACPSTSCNESDEAKQKSLWVGLDSSG